MIREVLTSPPVIAIMLIGAVFFGLWLQPFWMGRK